MDDPLATAKAAVAGGARAIVLREKWRSSAARRSLAEGLKPVLDQVGGLLLMASEPAPGADGVHLAASDPIPDPRPPVVGRSCHDRRSLEAAAAEGCDYATLSPIFATPSKPGYGPPLGVEALGAAPLPVYALGGVGVANAGACVTAGATGVAVMGAVMRAPDPARVVTELLAALERSQE
ncbi:MAG TPA: thiamine phosphate synthase [Acidimicrobiales bacterium]|nr:thiamine phosphate synthase [Acidimicrobiales bacterium]